MPFLLIPMSITKRAFIRYVNAPGEVPAEVNDPRVSISVAVLSLVKGDLVPPAD